MITIAIDLGNAPSVLAAFSDPALRDQLVKVGAESYVNEMLDWIDEGKAFTSRSGILEQSIGWNFVGDGNAEVYVDAEYAGYVEDGTEPHIIEPKPGRKALKIPSGNGYFFAKKVNHPGSKAHPFFFADRDNREQAMKSDILSVLAARLEAENG